VKDFIKNIFKSFLQLWDKKFSGLIIGILSVILIIFFSFSDTYKKFNLNLYDLNFTFKKSIDVSKSLVFLDIGDNSIDNIGKFPWPRGRYADAFRVLNKVGVSQIVLDIMFPNPSPLQLNKSKFSKIKQSLKKKNLKLKDLDSIVLNNDEIFAKSVKKSGNILLSYTFNPENITYDEAIRQNKKEFKVAIKQFLRRSSIPAKKENFKKYSTLDDGKIKSISYPIPALMNNGKFFGFVNRDTDIDGAVRKVKLVRFYKGRLYFNLAIMMLVKQTKIPLRNIKVFPGDKIVLKNAVNPIDFSKGDIEIPIDKNGMMFVNWAGNGTRQDKFTILPFYAVLEYENVVKDIKKIIIAEDKAKINAQNELSQAIEELKEEIASIDDKETVQIFKENLKAKQKEFASYKNFISLSELKQRESLLESKLLKAKIKSQRNLLSLKIDKNRSRIKKYKKNLILERKILLKEYKVKLTAIKDNDSQKQEFENNINALNYEIRGIGLVNRIDDLKGKITLTGLTASGTIDIGQTPLSNVYPMVGAYNNTYNTIINKKFITRIPSWLNYLLMIIFGISMGIIIQKLDAKKSLLSIAISVVAVNGLLTVIFMFFRIYFDQLGLSLAIFIPSLSMASVKFLKEESQKRFIKSAFSRYLSPGVIDQIIDNPDLLQLGGENREITIFFSDVAKFSTISEKLSPTELVELLNEYLSEMTDIILKYGGTVDKYEGDAIMAFFGAPISYEDHAKRTCLSVIDMKKRLRELQDKWEQEGKDALFVRMGINTGDAVVGNMGSRMRMDYTAMGDSVNLASRLEGANKHYSTYALVSENTYEQAKDFIEARKLDRIRVVGKTEPILIYELLAKKGDLPDYMVELREVFYEGLDFFDKRQWKKAKDSFLKGLKIVPDDGPSEVYVKRCEDFMKKPPSKKWDGVYTFNVK